MHKLLYHYFPNKHFKWELIFFNDHVGPFYLEIHSLHFWQIVLYHSFIITTFFFSNLFLNAYCVTFVFSVFLIYLNGINLKMEEMMHNFPIFKFVFNLNTAFEQVFFLDNMMNKKNLGFCLTHFSVFNFWKRSTFGVLYNSPRNHFIRFLTSFFQPS